MNEKEGYWFNLVIAFDQMFNAFLGGDHDVCFSTRAYVQSRLSGPYQGRWEKVEKVVNAIFFDVAHCKNSYLWELSKNIAWVQRHKGL